MSIENIIQKIEKKAALERKLYPRVTDEKIKYVLNIIDTQKYTKADGHDPLEGFYSYHQGSGSSSGGFEFIPNKDFYDRDYYTCTIDINTTRSVTARYRGLLDKDLVFVCKKKTIGSELIHINAGGKKIRDYSFEVPAGIETISVSYYKGADVTDFSLEIESTYPVDITPYVISWPNLEVTQSRQETSGVYVEVSSDMEFKEEAKDLIKELVETYGLYAKATLDIYKRFPHNNNYERLKSVLIDFQDYVLTDDIVTVGAVDISLQDIIESGKSTKFDIPVDDIKEEYVWGYERMDLINSANYVIPETVNFVTGAWNVNSYINIFQSTNEFIPGSVLHETSDQHKGNVDNSRFIFKALADVDLSLSMNFNVLTGEKSSIEYASITLLHSKGSNIIPLKKWDIIEVNEEDNLYVEIKEELKISLEPGDTLSFTFTASSTDHTLIDIVPLLIQDFKYLNIRWDAKGIPVDIDVIDPEKLLLAFLDRMSGEKGKYNGWIEWNERGLLRLCAAESVRGIENAILHGSFKDFIEWLRVLGYEYHFDNEQIVFCQRYDYFNPYAIALELSEKEVSDLRIEASSEFAYTKIEVGYEKQDYSNINGRFEINGTFDYSTGYVSAKENILSLISPYRSDSIGIEMLVWTRTSRTTDSKGDNDIFAVGLMYDVISQKYRYLEEGVMFVGKTKIYNGFLNPYYIAKRNEDIIGINCKRIVFEGTTSNREATVDVGLDLYQNLEVKKKLFKPFMYHFRTGNHLKLPDTNIQRSGLVVFKYKGKLYRGYIYEITKYYGSEKDSEWALYALD